MIIAPLYASSKEVALNILDYITQFAPEGSSIVFLTNGDNKDALEYV